MVQNLEHQFRETLGNASLQAAVYSGTGLFIQKRQAVVNSEALPEYQELRDQARAVKEHALENLDHYLKEFEKNLLARGGKVVWCRDASEARDFVAGLARRKNARLLVKSKSMTTEEISLNEHLERAGMEVVETDLGEYIVQLAGSRPYHIVVPALNMTRYDVADLFSRSLGIGRETVPENQTQIARTVLRDKFLRAEIGISGANFLVADSGAVVLVTNEGNGRMTSTLPRIHVAIAGIEKIIPRAQDLAVFLKLLGRSATGQPLTVYTSFLSGPRRRDEIDGPDELYVVLLDNGRSRVLSDPGKRSSLCCLRCGACLNHCPVYRKIGGHNYPWVYSGPIGSVISPLFRGLDRDPWLPFASSLCGACGEVCPVKIEIPKMLLDLRSEVNEMKARQDQGGLERAGFAAWAWLMSHPRIYGMIGRWGSFAIRILGLGKHPFRLPAWLNFGPLGHWNRERDLPPLPRRSFRELWRERTDVRNDHAA
jgi:L-lactate dehydrogenase complex protein LldF